MRSTDTWDPARQSVMYRNELNQCLGRLVGICEGVLGDQVLTDHEIHFLRDWLTNNDAVAFCWPGNVIAAKVREILADGVVTESERAHLLETLRQLMGGKDVAAAESIKPIQLGLDEPEVVLVEGRAFCLTGDFVFGPRDRCERAISERGGIVRTGVSRKVHYVVVGGLGSPEWKHGSFGTKIEKAMILKQQGAAISVIKEACWTRAFQPAPDSVSP